MSQQDIELREKFLFTLDWLLAVTKRYSTDVKFDLPMSILQTRDCLVTRTVRKRRRKNSMKYCIA